MRHVIALLVIVVLSFGAQLLFGDRFGRALSSHTAAVADQAEEAAIGFLNAAGRARPEAEPAPGPDDGGTPLGWDADLNRLAGGHVGPPPERVQELFLTVAGWLAAPLPGEPRHAGRRAPGNLEAVAVAARWLLPRQAHGGAHQAITGFAWRPVVAGGVIELAAASDNDVPTALGPAAKNRSEGSIVTIGAGESDACAGAPALIAAARTIAIALPRDLGPLPCTLDAARRALAETLARRLPPLLALVDQMLVTETLRAL
jgi:hypothetical protein